MSNYYEKIRSFFKKEIRLLRQYGMTPRFDTSDVAQESCLQFFKNYSECEANPELPVSLLKQIAFGHVAKQNRFSRSQKRSIDREEHFYNEMAKHNDSPEQSVVANELTQQLLAMIEKLEPLERTVIQLRSLEELTFPDVAVRMNMTERVVRRAYENAFAKLMIKLAESG